MGVCHILKIVQMVQFVQNKLLIFWWMQSLTKYIRDSFSHFILALFL